MDARLRLALDRWGCAHPRPLSGGAGVRRYFRVEHPSLGSALVVLYPPLQAGQDEDPYFEFRALHAYLDPVMRVPTIIQAWDDHRMLLLEDLGETTLEARLVAHPEEETAWAERAGWLLGTWLGPLTLGAPPQAFFMARRLDHARLDFEWAFSRAHFFNDFLQKDPPKWLDRMMDEVHATLHPRARFLAHREFNVRNLMVQGDNLVVLNFQDAGCGPATCDLATILFDGYWDWSREAGARLLGQVRKELGWAEQDLLEELRLSALQRNFKALGAFGYQIVTRKKGHFAPAIPRTLRHIRGHFQRLHNGEGVLAAEHWLRVAEKRLWQHRGDEEAGALG
ncbi:MAG: phosphotransferase [Acidobacteria bacterium]|nr:phosphotransferase [Acidobacteriota bacterium]